MSSKLKQALMKLQGAFALPGFSDIVDQLKDPLEFKDPEERAAAIEENIALLQKQMKKMEEQWGIDISSSKEFMENPGHFTREEWEILKLLSYDLEDYTHDVIEEFGESSPGKEGEAAPLKKSPEAKSGKKKKGKKKPPDMKGGKSGWIPT